MEHSKKSKKYLLFASHNYAYSILRPIQKAIRERGDEAAWWLEYTCPDHLQKDEKRLYTLREIRDFDPIAVLAPGNWVYPFFPGIKVEVFHGYPMRKRIEAVDDHFTLRGWWDIYCTQGESSTPTFLQLAQQHRYFRIYETGWPKIDAFFDQTEQQPKSSHRPSILYAPTFSRGITSVETMAPVIEKLSQEKDWDWLITFHPKIEDPAIIRRYEQLAQRCPNVTFRRYNDGLNDLKQTDLLLCDSSSLIVEYLMLGKPTVTFRNTHPGPFLVDVHEPDQIGDAIEYALTYPKELLEAMAEYTNFHEAHRDGHNSLRVLEAIDDFATNYKGRLPRKPFSLTRFIKVTILFIKTRIHYPHE